LSICEVLADCLAVDVECLSWWVGNLLHQMKSSSFLLKYIKENSATVNEKIGKGRKYREYRPLATASQKIIANLDQANEKGRFEKKPGFRECRKICVYFVQTEMARRKETSFLWKLVKYTFILTCLVVAIDLYTSKGYQGSKSSVFMKKYNLEKKMIVSYNYVQGKTNELTGCVMTHAPKYYAKVSPYVEPVMEKTCHYTKVALDVIYVHSKPLRDFTNKNLPPLLEKITYFVRRQYEIITSYLLDVYNTYSPIVQESVLNAYDWLVVSIPLAYNHTLNTLVILKHTIYNLNPELFDKAAVIINDAIAYVIKMVPVVVERGRECVLQGQGWMQQQFNSASAAAKWVS